MAASFKPQQSHSPAKIGHKFRSKVPFPFLRLPMSGVFFSMLALLFIYLAPCFV